MKYRQLGKSSLHISEIGFGCMSLAEDQHANTQLLHQAIDAGINFFDTADLYQKGWNEESVGKALASKRQQVVLATKVGNRWRADGSGWDWTPDKAYIIAQVEKSLTRLRTDYIDLYQLHGGTIDDPILEIIEAFEQLREQGKIRYYGISSIRPHVISQYVQHSRIVSVMMQYSLLDRRPEEQCLALLLENRIGVLARGPLAKGLLVNKEPAEYAGYSELEVEKAATAIRAVSGPQRSAAQTALRFVLDHPAVTSAVTGIRTRQQLADAAGAISSPALTPQEMHHLQQAIPPDYYENKFRI